GRNAACIDRDRSSVSRQRWYGALRVGTEHKFPVLPRRGCGTALCTVEGRQTGGLRQKCGSALIRKVKLSARSCGSSSLFLRRWLTKPIERVRAMREGWVLRRILVVDDDLHTRLAISIWRAAF